ncbi:hypothetical protein [Rhodovulum sulfidophilum]|uniref:hypothetical protein n=1 Tax=Rhodovulum sulfidophilum TaxID=35806 RepID=UPI0009513C73|nr:hypothetical protein [Rhodovulum sulfidophilum]MBL3553870.1 hypothetical protein [Rhodovulum sulfidophilum]OLS47684.1 hypothetical protein BV379_04845 [Rhodovulum sulfidophilum]
MSKPEAARYRTTNWKSYNEALTPSMPASRPRFSILKDLGFQAGRSNTGGKAMSFDSMADLVDPVVGPRHASQNITCLRRSKT